MRLSILSLFILLSALTIKAQKESFDICPIKNSEEIPSAIVYDIGGDEIDLKDYIEEKPAVIVFYRGGWCPYCMRHLSALQEAKDDMDQLGYELIAITPDDFKNLDSSKAAVKDLDFTLFSDKEIKAINAFNIGWKVNDELFSKYKNKYGLDLEWWSDSEHRTLPVPAVFVVKDGKIQYQHVDPNYSQRLPTKVLLSYLEALEEKD